MRNYIQLLICCAIFSCHGVWAEDMDQDGEFGDWDEYIVGTNPGGDSNIFKLDSVNLDPDTFIVTLTTKVTVSANRYAGILAHVGAPGSTNTWHVVGSKPCITERLIFVDNTSSRLTEAGITYCSFITLEPVNPGVIFTSLNSSVCSVNEKFVAYPVLTNPVVTIEQAVSSDELLIGFSDGIYSNEVRHMLSAGQNAGFIRMVSTNRDPANAHIQIKGNLQEEWIDLEDP